jgi:uncharacterized membrane protein YgcG
MRLAWLLLLATCLAGAGWPPRPAEGLLFDEAGLLSAPISARVARLEAGSSQRGCELAVVIVRDWHRSGAANVSAFAHELSLAWGLRSQSILLVVSVDQREGTIELGEGWSGGWRDWSRYILDEQVLTNLKNGRVSDAVLKGTDSLAELSHSDPASSPPALGQVHMGRGAHQFADRWGRFSLFPADALLGVFLLGAVLTTAGLAFPQGRRYSIPAGVVVMGLALCTLPAGAVTVAWALFALWKRRSRPRLPPPEKPPLYL